MKSILNNERFAKAFQTNRDLYRFIADLCQRHATSKRSLEDYLKVLWLLACPHRELTGLPLVSFANFLEAAFRREPPPFDPIWRQHHQHGHRGLEGYRRWERTVIDQIVDLHEMEQAGT